ncbi:MAG: hypothetical protein AAGI38_23615 [Bacteroidota bacterium]
MPKYTFHIDPKLPGKDRIRSHRNFGEVYARYETATRRSFWQRLFARPRRFASLVVVFLIAFLVYEAEVEMRNSSLRGFPLDITNQAAEALGAIGQDSQEGIILNLVQHPDIHKGFALDSMAEAFEVKAYYDEKAEKWVPWEGNEPTKEGIYFLNRKK